ncbi:receptor-type tyrosine-protein phosphatase F-like isoform X1 [Odontomachus brunneus]|uniref:receptor-type tyrosine-protein phosphatase F-like isoform X1 n=1 Tax=Odontomachus brunneus TaxID=486640 RepID=UPI0013F27EBA|nr:receptor-type tyrosine-protein phosphatase F-like isoform X1 [Odontomachus brunneus]
MFVSRTKNIVRCVTMSRIINKIFILILLMNQVVNIFGNLITLSGPTFERRKRVLCISENDGSALVWNSDLKYKYYPRKNIIDPNAEHFSDTCTLYNSQVDCKLDNENGCLRNWERNHWKIINSIDIPMGPVFDRRWEDFKEYTYSAETVDVLKLLNKQLTNTLVLPFSIRATKDVHIMICNNYYRKNLCYWVIIGGWDNTKSVIRKCLEGVPDIGVYPAEGSECAKERDYLNHTALHEYEWRTFVLTWNSETKNISLYDPDRLIVTYKDMDIYNNINFTYKLYIRSSSSMRIKYHKYDYLYTSTNNAILTSNIFNITTEDLCLQMLIGLCAQCDADVSLHTSDKILKTIIVKGSSVAAVHGLPMWQAVKITTKIAKSDYNDLKIEVTPKLNLNISNPISAIADVRRCPSDGCLRQSRTFIYQDWDKPSWRYFWPNVTCQKLFYEEKSVIKLFKDADLNVELDDKNCSAGNIGPACKFHCSSELDSTNCYGVVICNDNGCTCASGWKGAECVLPCNNNFYGHACINRCGSCSQGKQCDPISGVCHNGCRNAENYVYVPPLCQIGIDKPNETVFTFTNQTTIVATIPIKWEKVYEEIDLFYKFNIKKLDEKFVKQYEWKRVSQDNTKLEEIFENLVHDTTYRIQWVLLINQVPVYGEWKNVDTHCDLIKNFNITPNETSLMIVAETENQLYQCWRNWYDLLFIKNNTEEDGIIHLSTFPYTLQNLTPYTSYNVTILYRKKKLFSKEIRTFEGVPSKVVSLTALSLSSTNVSLFWISPKRANGVIMEYVIQLTVAKYFGCKGVRVISPLSSKYILVEGTNKTEITLSGLHAYAKYNVEVTARNSRYSSVPAKTEFSLPETVIPVVTFGTVKMENWVLSWKSPEDCTAILGPLFSKIEIRGISDAVKNFNVTKNTKLMEITLRNILHGVEHYVAKIFASRGYHKPINTSAYIEYNFETPPKEPPNVTNLDVVEVESYKTIYLRWQSPIPPLNGVLRGYGIVICPYRGRRIASCKKIEVQLNETCELWDSYICKSILYTEDKIEVVAYNDVNTSNSVNVTVEMLNNAQPDPPRNFNFAIGNNSVVDLQWLHPWRTGRHLLQFMITVENVMSNLTDHLSRAVRSFNENSSYELSVAVTNYTPSYCAQLRLLPSTKYIISIISVTTENVNSNMSTLNFSTPSTVNFKGNITSEVYDSDSTIVVHIPQIVDDTRNSILYIIVKGPHRDCNNYVSPHKSLWKQAGVQMYDIFWQAAAILAQNISNGMDFTIGNGDIYDNAINCYLVSGELYDITIIISEPNFHYEPIMITRKISKRIGVKQNHPESWLIPLVMIIFTAIVAFWFFRRKRQKSNKPLVLQDEMALSQNNKSYVHDKKVITESFKEDSSTPSDRQSLSRATTPEITNIVVESNDEEEEITSLVKVKDFEDYVRQAIVSGLLNKQYETFPRGQTQPWDYGKQPQNKTKNRYGNLIAYDETRVILKKLPDDAYSDYINANYITGYKKKKRYIATQGPKPNTVVDFWRMIWQEKVLIICMLANVVENGKTKCEQYWPDIGKKKKYGEIVVLNATHNVFADYCFRTLHITYENETRKVEHLHYTAWPDHGVPMYTHSVVTYLKKLLATPPGDGPVVVHCSAGVGRTGTIVLCDICLHRAAAEGMVDVFAETASIRRERANMVDNKQQYLLAHLALVECLITIPTTLPCNETLPTRIKELKKQLSVQQHQLQNTAWQDEALRPITSLSSLSECNRAKNRFPELISDKVSRIYLKRYPSSDEDSDYLSAVYVDGVKLQNQYLAAQLPMPSTINDFWRMITEFKVELIVMLQPPDPEDSTCCAIAPANGEFKPTPYLNIIVKEIVELENYTLQKLLLVDNSEKPSREQSVTILCCTEWKPGRNQPPPPVMALVTFWQATERIARGDGPTVTLCHDGVTGCGLYLALSFMLERMAVERECDICLSVRAVRRSRADFVGSLEHLEYLYDAAITYLEYFETYANFS